MEAHIVKVLTEDGLDIGGRCYRKEQLEYSATGGQYHPVLPVLQVSLELVEPRRQDADR